MKVGIILQIKSFKNLAYDIFGKDSYIAAGSTITSDVPPLGLGIGRARQTNKEDWVSTRNRIRGAKYIELDRMRYEV